MVFGLSKRSRRAYSSDQSALDPCREYDDFRQRRIYAAPSGPHSVEVLPCASHFASSHPYLNRGQIAAASMAQLPPPQVPAPLVLPTASVQPAILPTSLSGLTEWTNSTFNHPISGILSHTIGKANATISDLDHLIHRSIGDGVNLRDAPSRVLDEVITSIDMGSFGGRERDILAGCSLPFRTDLKNLHKSGKKPNRSGSVDYFSKVYLYENSRMPSNLPRLKLSIPSYPLLRLAAQYSRRVYDGPVGGERHAYVDSDWRQGTKAMVIKSLPVDDLNTIVFAIRGTQSFLDWAVNFHTAPTSPAGFLDDLHNYCHAGFLSVARKMVGPIAAHLRALLAEDPSRMSYSLLITGHSAGGAVASLLYLHILSESPMVQSDLTHLRGCFRSIHCVTFGAPPISIRPLQQPLSSGFPRSKSLFLSFINEGDPVTRADKAYIVSLLDLYVRPAPRLTLYRPRDYKIAPAPNYWHVPPATLANAGKLVLLRDRDRGPLNGPIIAPARKPDGPPPLPRRQLFEACVINDAQLRGVVFGDPVMHMMDLYARRIEILAGGVWRER
ncbi:hypothetical protein N7474_003553 [Penicillium riverlandense]|uniref:uncharacterized protein n=1 Tax=Penicillium riverlandense TaxID=1903569 RepID=UPI002547E583|nr:uncharacterized protein N7474_003553 [Penicillium riverlandense]KAJ5826415.1 hypothetical protein N7474_003553 [Penicillium riverlandense]